MTFIASEMMQYFKVITTQQKVNNSFSHSKFAKIQRIAKSKSAKIEKKSRNG